MATICAPASQDSSHVGNAGVGYYHEGCEVALPTLAAAQFRRFFDCDRVIQCLLPSVVPGGCADADVEQLAFTEQLFDAAFWGAQCCC